MDHRPRLIAAALAIAFAMSACTPSPSLSPSGTPTPITTAVPTVAPSPTAASRAGGTIYLLKQFNFNDIDPQRVYTYEDSAFLGATIYRSLLWYSPSPDPIIGTTLTPDLATDLGRPTDGGRTWSFSLRDGATFQTGDPITCEDIKYGVSRVFANDVISGGPTYVIQYLDIPANPITDEADPKTRFLSAYYGPYDGTGQDLYDRAVQCSPDHRTITFHLREPIANFNALTTLGFSPVPRAADIGEMYGRTAKSLPVSTGPYMVESYAGDQSGTMVLVRNPAWSAASDPIRKAYPDRWHVEFGPAADVIDQRLVASAGNDAFAIADDTLEATTLPSVFVDPLTPHAQFASRAVSGLGPYARYAWINTERVTSVKIRQAMLVALDRAAIRDILGGEFYGGFADGVLMPNVGQDYAPTGIWDSFFGQPVPDSGDPELARRLIRESGETPPALKFILTANTTTYESIGDVVAASLGRAGLTVEVVPACEGYGCQLGHNRYDFGTLGWGADVPSASTVIPPLFTKKGGWDLSEVDDPAFNTAVDDALTTLDRTEQARKWQALNRHVVEKAWVIPTFFGRNLRLAGTGVGPIYLWPAYQSWPYSEMYVTP